MEQKSSGEFEQIVEFARHLARDVRESVRPHLGSSHAKGHLGEGASGDVTFGIDAVAEKSVEKSFEKIDDIAYYTEDRGLISHGNPRYLLVIDPIDGTRPAAAGLESCCVTVAIARIGSKDHRLLTVGDIVFGLVEEIKNDAEYEAVKRKGAIITRDSRRFSPVLLSTSELSRIFWTTGFRGRPAEPIVTALGGLIDKSSVDGACFDLGSAAFGITRVATGEMDTYVDIGQRIVEEIPILKKRFMEIGHGAILNNYSYDVAAAALVASECGACVSDAYGKPIDGYALVPDKEAGLLSVIVSANSALHSLVIDAVDEGMERLKKKYL
ncbi:MAG: hypothetical protein PHP64_04930 [Actinomycetota bacterium]|nr:hypothetical protein [Actinomycetota bacterium]